MTRFVMTGSPKSILVGPFDQVVPRLAFVRLGLGTHLLGIDVDRFGIILGSQDRIPPEVTLVEFDRLFGELMA